MEEFFAGKIAYIFSDIRSASKFVEEYEKHPEIEVYNDLELAISLCRYTSEDHGIMFKNGHLHICSDLYTLPTEVYKSNPYEVSLI